MTTDLTIRVNVRTTRRFLAHGCSTTTDRIAVVLTFSVAFAMRHAAGDNMWIVCLT